MEKQCSFEFERKYTRLFQSALFFVTLHSMVEREILELSSGTTGIYLMCYPEYDPNDYLDHLTELEQERFFQFTHIRRRREFMATRILRQRIFGFQHIHYDSVGAPYIEGEGYISISHSPGLVGIALNPLYRVGLDLELPREKIVAIAPKFINEEESRFFDVNDSLEMTRVWSAKEALYKLAGRKKIIFKEELLLSKDADGNWLGRILNPEEEILVQLEFLEHQNTVITINSRAIEFVARNL